MQDGMKMGSAKSGYQGRDRRQDAGEWGIWRSRSEEYRGRGREQYGYHEIKEHAGRDFPFNIYPALFRLISGRFLFTGMRIWRLLR